MHYKIDVIILGYIFHNDERRSTGYLSASAMDLGEKPAEQITALRMAGYASSLEVLGRVSSGGFVTAIRDLDGIVRSSPLVLHHQQQLRLNQNHRA